VFLPSKRAKPVERSTKLAVAPGNGSQQRDDWIALNTSVVVPAPSAASPTASPTATPAATPPAIPPATPPATPTAAAGSAGAASAASPGAPAAAPAAAAKDADELYRSTAERLRALEKLRKDGLITEAEYLDKRREILRGL